MRILSNRVLNFSANWILPMGVTRFLRNYKAFWRDSTSGVFTNNAKLEKIYLARRCFILANGPSISTQDLSFLKNEIVFSVSQGYLHQDYQKIKPVFHCLPEISYSALPEGKKSALNFLKLMDESLSAEKVFLNLTERDIVEKNQLFRSREVFYLDCSAAWDERNNAAIPDIVRKVPRTQSVTIMALMVALYMGFEEIYLIGTDHNAFQTGVYKYPFKSSISVSDNYAVTNCGQVKGLHDELIASAALWRQYRALKHISVANDCKILNATAGGALDEFERVSLSDIKK